MSIAHYLGDSLWLSGVQLATVLGPIVVLAYVMHRVSGVLRKSAMRIFGDGIYVWTTALGTMVHELGHALFCVVFRHRIVNMQLFRPDANGNLGFVDHTFNPKSRYQRVGNFFIGTGPIWLGSAVMVAITWFFLGDAPFEPLQRVDVSTVELTSLAGARAFVQDIGGVSWDIITTIFQRQRFSEWMFFLFLYLVFCIGSHVTLSAADIKNTALGVTTLIGGIIALNVATLWMGDYVPRASAALAGYTVVICGVMFVAVVINAALAAVLWIPARAFDD